MVAPHPFPRREGTRADRAARGVGGVTDVEGRANGRP